jgi:hypothetical protein
MLFFALSSDQLLILRQTSRFVFLLLGNQSVIAVRQHLIVALNALCTLLLQSCTHAAEMSHILSDESLLG